MADPGTCRDQDPGRSLVGTHHLVCMYHVTHEYKLVFKKFVEMLEFGE